VMTQDETKSRQVRPMASTSFDFPVKGPLSSLRSAARHGYSQAAGQRGWGPNGPAHDGA
jgi:hypothetical protein